MSKSSGIPTNINSEHLVSIEDDLKTIFEHELFENVQESNAIGLAAASTSPEQQQGHKAAFDQGALDIALAEGGAGLYDSACNFFWADPRFNIEHGIPINVAALLCIQILSFIVDLELGWVVVGGQGVEFWVNIASTSCPSFD